jgi:hypothetical protein
MSFVVAYAFRSDFSLSQILDAVRANTSWEWLARDSEFWGEYLSAQSSAQPVLAKIFVEGNAYLLELKFQDDGLRESWEPVARGIVNLLLPPLAAIDIRRAEANN